MTVPGVAALSWARGTIPAAMTCQNNNRLPRAACAAWLCALSVAAHADGEPPLELEAHGQATFIRQAKPAFHAPYGGPVSLGPLKEYSRSFTATGFIGLRLAPQTELYWNPELVSGVPLSNLTGLGGLTNGELQKTAGPNYTMYTARLFVRHTWGLGGEVEKVESDTNQLAGTRSADRIVLTAGNFAASDIFDANRYAHDARSQFMNWSLLTHGAWDFAADARGYSWGAALEYVRGDWALRAGRFAQPRVPNGLQLDMDLRRHYGDQVELERGWRWGERQGRIRLLAFSNRVRMGGYADALAAAPAGTAPTLDAVRRERSKRGWGVNLEQELTPTLGAFARWARSDGASEPYAFAEIDRSASVGAVLRGDAWRRAQDTVGLAFARNGLSGVHRAFLAAGGTGFFVGDGRLNYKPEQVVEGYYSAALPAGPLKNAALSLGVQYIRNPAYNADRGPVRVYSLRLHADY